MKIRLYDDEIYHVFNKSISNYGIFKVETNCHRFLSILDYYNSKNCPYSFSTHLFLKRKYELNNLLYPKKDGIIKFLSYCIMPDHYHLIVKILNHNNFIHYMNNVGNSYSRYFNIKINRKGPLWQSDYKIKRITNDRLLLHVSRYVHLNPSTSGLVDDPKKWKFSSYNDFISNKLILNKYISEISISSRVQYKKFVENNIDYQRKLKTIKRLIFE